MKLTLEEALWRSSWVSGSIVPRQDKSKRDINASANKFDKSYPTSGSGQDESWLRAVQQGVAIEHVMAVLKAERMKKGLSLADMKDRTGIERSTLSRLENNGEANPTLKTLARYADAVGKKVRVVLVEAD